MAEGLGLNRAVKNYYAAKDRTRQSATENAAAALASEKHSLEKKKLEAEIAALEEERRARMAALMHYTGQTLPGQARSPAIPGAETILPGGSSQPQPKTQTYSPGLFAEQNNVRVERMVPGQVGSGGPVPQASAMTSSQQDWGPGPFDVTNQGPASLVARESMQAQRHGAGQQESPIVQAMAKALARRGGDKATLKQIDSDMAGFTQAENALKKISLEARTLKENLDAYNLALQQNPEDADRLSQAIAALETKALLLQRQRDEALKTVMDFKSNMVKIAVKNGLVDPELFRHIAVMMQEGQKNVGNAQNPYNRAQMVEQLKKRYEAPPANLMPKIFK